MTEVNQQRSVSSKRPEEKRMFRQFFVLIGILPTVLVLVASPLEAQQAKKIPRIGLLSGGDFNSSRSQVEGFRQGLHELGYVEGENILVEYRWAAGNSDRYPVLAGELVHLKADVVVTLGTQATLAAKQVTNTIPIVAGDAGDLVGEGLVASLARPGGNVTGLTNIDPDLSAKRLQLLKEILPKMIRMAVLYHGGPGGDQEELSETQTAAHPSRIQIQPIQVKESSQFQSAYAAMLKERADALVSFHGSFTGFHRRELIELAFKHKLPTMCGSPVWTTDGGLISYGHDRHDQFRRAAIYVDKILKGTKPAELPVQQPTKFELVINQKTANQIGVTIPASVLARADKVIK
jgi:putative ABC transport system substrate-binding protein